LIGAVCRLGARICRKPLLDLGLPTGEAEAIASISWKPAMTDLYTVASFNDHDAPAALKEPRPSPHSDTLVRAAQSMLVR